MTPSIIGQYRDLFLPETPTRRAIMNGPASAAKYVDIPGALTDDEIAAHLAGDQGLALGLAAAGGIMAFAGEATAAALFAGAAVLHLALILVTRYTAR